MICDICDVPFKNNQTLNRHKRKKHGIFKRLKQETFDCDDCGASFRGKKNLRKHIRAVHLGIKKLNLLSCPVCTSSVKNYYELRSHISEFHGEIISEETYIFNNKAG